MKFDQLQYFFAVSKTQHVGKAAKQLNISPSAISHSIAMLEEELGRPLVEKTGKNICLTAHGKRLAERAEKILAEVENTKHEIASADIQWQGTFRIGATHGLIEKWIVPAWAAIQKKNPQVMTECFSFRSSHVVEQVRNGTLDLGVCYAPQTSPGVTIQKLIEVPLNLVVRPKHRALNLKGPALIAWLNENPCALPKAFLGIDVCEQHPDLKRLEVNPQLSFAFDAYDVAATYLRETDGWGMIPEPFCRWHRLASLPVLGWKATTFVAAVSLKDRMLPRPLAELTEQLKQVFPTVPK